MDHQTVIEGEHLKSESISHNQTLISQVPESPSINLTLISQVPESPSMFMESPYRMRRPWKLLNLGSKHIFLNIHMIAANTLNTCTAPFPSAELRCFINHLIIIIIIIKI